MDLELAKELLDDVIDAWYTNGQLDQVDVSLLEVAHEIISDWR